jgi:hypothetical protein
MYTIGITGKSNEQWKLLDETASLLNRTAVRSRFEKQLAAIAVRFQSAPVNLLVLKEVQAALTELRKQLRLLGYDLSMGKYTLIFDGFRNDDVLGRFTRMVLFIDQNNVFYWKTGNENHVTLDYLLENSIRKIRLAGKQPKIQIRGRHYLWFLRTKSCITLSGSATESAEAYEQLKAYAGADNLLFLSRLKGIC